MAVRYINSYTDFGFKKLFGEEANKDLLIDILKWKEETYAKVRQETEGMAHG